MKLSDEPSGGDSCYESDDDEVTSSKPVPTAPLKKQVVQNQKKTLEQRLDALPIAQCKRFST